MKNLDFIAHAPDDIAALLAALAVAEREAAEANEEAQRLEAAVLQRGARIERLEAVVRQAWAKIETNEDGWEHLRQPGHAAFYSYDDLTAFKAAIDAALEEGGNVG